MKNQESLLSEPQQQLLNAFLVQTGKQAEQAIGKNFDLVHQGNRKDWRWEQITIAANISDAHLLELARLGYLKVYANTTPASIVFTEKVLEQSTRKDEEERNASDYEDMTAKRQVRRMDMIQVYAWLIASLFAALFFLLLLWITIQQALMQHIPASIVAGTVDVISGSLTAVFFNNWNKANQLLNPLRSALHHVKNLEADK